MTRQEMNEGSRLFIHANHSVGTGEYWTQMALNNWHENINNIQSRFANFEEYREVYFRTVLATPPSDYTGHIYTLMDA